MAPLNRRQTFVVFLASLLITTGLALVRVLPATAVEHLILMIVAAAAGISLPAMRPRPAPRAPLEEERRGR